MSKLIIYEQKEIPIRDGAWLDEMNACFYDRIDNVSVKNYIICQDRATKELFAIQGYLPINIKGGKRV